jgi:hypothetical protein
MFFIELEGYGYSKPLCENVVHWFLDKYLRRYKLDIIITHRGLKRELVHGWAHISDRDYNPRCFIIEIQSNLEKKFYISTLLHELWHVYQWVKGDLKERGTKRMWKGIDHSESDYEEQPWEQEAYEREVVLLKEYLTEYPISN